MGTRSQKRTVGASLWIIFKATKTRFGMRKSALQAGHLTSSLPSSNFSKRFASGVIVIWVWQPLHGTSIEPAQRSAPVKLISFLSSGIATPICYPSPDRSGTILAQQQQTHGWSCAQSVHWIDNPMQHHHECALRRLSEVFHFPICQQQLRSFLIDWTNLSHGPRRMTALRIRLEVSLAVPYVAHAARV